MDPLRNSFAPGAGSRPPELAGRDAILEGARVSCGRALLRKSARSMILLGLRGTGKTVLLNAIARNAEAGNLLVSKVESPEGESLARRLYPEMRRVMRALSGVDAARQLVAKGFRGLRGFASIFKSNSRESKQASSPSRASRIPAICNMICRSFSPLSAGRHRRAAGARCCSSTSRNI